MHSGLEVHEPIRFREAITMPSPTPDSPPRDPQPATPRREPDVRTPVRREPDESTHPDERGPLKREDPEVLPDDPDIAGDDGSSQPS